MSEVKKDLDLEKEFALVSSKAEDGIWVPYKSARFLIASTSSKAFVNARDLLYAKYPTKESLASDEAQKRYEAIIAQYILLGWEGFTVAYSGEEARKKLAIDGFRRWVMEVAGNDSHYKAAQEEELAKN